MARVTFGIHVKVNAYKRFAIIQKEIKKVKLISEEKVPVYKQSPFYPAVATVPLPSLRVAWMVQYVGTCYLLLPEAKPVMILEGVKAIHSSAIYRKSIVVEEKEYELRTWMNPIQL
tara:strand:+ start:22 stop:369 length:348 start_codon:yes stop_codon:yes gene_type:complete